MIDLKTSRALTKRGAEVRLEGDSSDQVQRQLELNRVADEAKVLAARRWL